MSNCTGYTFSSFINLCADGPVGDGNTANLDVQVSVNQIDGGRVNTTVADWDGTEVVVDLTDFVGTGNFSIAFFSPSFFEDTCDVDSAQLTISPDSTDAATGILKLDIVISNCSGRQTTTPSATTTSAPEADIIAEVTTVEPTPTIDENCGSSGPHTITEMMAFSLSEGGSCGIGR